MPRYELAVITQLFGREKKIEVLKDIVKYLLNEGHNVRKVQSLGDKGLPFQMFAHEINSSYGSYSLFDVDVRLKDLEAVQRYFDSNLNVIRMTCTPRATLYLPEPICEGVNPVNYEEKLKELKQKKANSK